MLMFGAVKFARLIGDDYSLHIHHFTLKVKITAPRGILRYAKATKTTGNPGGVIFVSTLCVAMLRVAT